MAWYDFLNDSSTLTSIKKQISERKKSLSVKRLSNQVECKQSMTKEQSDFVRFRSAPYISQPRKLSNELARSSLKVPYRTQIRSYTNSPIKDSYSYPIYTNLSTVVTPSQNRYTYQQTSRNFNTNTKNDDIENYDIKNITLNCETTNKEQGVFSWYKKRSGLKDTSLSDADDELSSCCEIYSRSIWPSKTYTFPEKPLYNFQHKTFRSNSVNNKTISSRQYNNTNNIFSDSSNIYNRGVLAPRKINYIKQPIGCKINNSLVHTHKRLNNANGTKQNIDLDTQVSKTLSASSQLRDDKNLYNESISNYSGENYIKEHRSNSENNFKSLDVNKHDTERDVETTSDFHVTDELLDRTIFTFLPIEKQSRNNDCNDQFEKNENVQFHNLVRGYTPVRYGDLKPYVNTCATGETKFYDKTQKDFYSNGIHVINDINYSEMTRDNQRLMSVDNNLDTKYIQLNNNQSTIPNTIGAAYQEGYTLEKEQIHNDINNKSNFVTYPNKPFDNNSINLNSDTNNQLSIENYRNLNNPNNNLVYNTNSNINSLNNNLGTNNGLNNNPIRIINENYNSTPNNSLNIDQNLNNTFGSRLTIDNSPDLISGRTSYHQSNLTALTNPQSGPLYIPLNCTQTVLDNSLTDLEKSRNIINDFAKTEYINNSTDDKILITERPIVQNKITLPSKIQKYNTNETTKIRKVHFNKDNKDDVYQYSITAPTSPIPINNSSYVSSLGIYDSRLENSNFNKELNSKRDTDTVYTQSDNFSTNQTNKYSDLRQQNILNPGKYNNHNINKEEYFKNYDEQQIKSLRTDPSSNNNVKFDPEVLLSTSYREELSPDNKDHSGYCMNKKDRYFNNINEIAPLPNTRYERNFVDSDTVKNTNIFMIMHELISFIEDCFNPTLESQYRGAISKKRKLLNICLKLLDQQTSNFSSTNSILQPNMSTANSDHNEILNNIENKLEDNCKRYSSEDNCKRYSSEDESSSVLAQSTDKIYRQNQSFIKDISQPELMKIEKTKDSVKIDSTDNLIHNSDIKQNQKKYYSISKNHDNQKFEMKKTKQSSNEYNIESDHGINKRLSKKKKTESCLEDLSKSLIININSLIDRLEHLISVVPQKSQDILRRTKDKLIDYTGSQMSQLRDNFINKKRDLSNTKIYSCINDIYDTKQKTNDDLQKKNNRQHDNFNNTKNNLDLFSKKNDSSYKTKQLSPLLTSSFYEQEQFRDIKVDSGTKNSIILTDSISLENENLISKNNKELSALVSVLIEKNPRIIKHLINSELGLFKSKKNIHMIYDQYHNTTDQSFFCSLPEYDISLIEDLERTVVSNLPNQNSYNSNKEHDICDIDSVTTTIVDDYLKKSKKNLNLLKNEIHDSLKINKVLDENSQSLVNENILKNDYKEYSLDSSNDPNKLYEPKVVNDLSQNNLFNHGTKSQQNIPSEYNMKSQVALSSVSKNRNTVNGLDSNIINDNFDSVPESIFQKFTNIVKKSFKASLNIINSVNSSKEDLSSDYTESDDIQKWNKKKHTITNFLLECKNIALKTNNMEKLQNTLNDLTTLRMASLAKDIGCKRLYSDCIKELYLSPNFHKFKSFKNKSSTSSQGTISTALLNKISQFDFSENLDILPKKVITSENDLEDIEFFYNKEFRTPSESTFLASSIDISKTDSIVRCIKESGYDCKIFPDIMKLCSNNSLTGIVSKDIFDSSFTDIDVSFNQLENFLLHNSNQNKYELHNGVSELESYRTEYSAEFSDCTYSIEHEWTNIVMESNENLYNSYRIFNNFNRPNNILENSLNNQDYKNNCYVNNIRTHYSKNVSENIRPKISSDIFHQTNTLVNSRNDMLDNIYSTDILEDFNEQHIIEDFNEQHIIEDFNEQHIIEDFNEQHIIEDSSNNIMTKYLINSSHDTYILSSEEDLVPIWPVRQHENFIDLNTISSDKSCKDDYSKKDIKSDYRRDFSDYKYVKNTINKETGIQISSINTSVNDNLENIEENVYQNKVPNNNENSICRSKLNFIAKSLDHDSMKIENIKTENENSELIGTEIFENLVDRLKKLNEYNDYCFTSNINNKKKFEIYNNTVNTLPVNSNNWSEYDKLYEQISCDNKSYYISENDKAIMNCKDELSNNLYDNINFETYIPLSKEIYSKNNFARSKDNLKSESSLSDFSDLISHSLDDISRSPSYDITLNINNPKILEGNYSSTNLCESIEIPHIDEEVLESKNISRKYEHRISNSSKLQPRIDDHYTNQSNSFESSQKLSAKCDLARIYLARVSKSNKTNIFSE